MHAPSQTLRNRLVLWFLLLSLTPLVVVVFVSMSFARADIERNAVAMLKAIATEKAARLDEYVRERLRHVEGISTGVAFITAAEELAQAYEPTGQLDEQKFRTATARFQPRAESWARIVDVPDFQLIDATGRIVYASHASPFLHRALGDPALSASSLARGVDMVRRSQAPVIAPAEIAVDGIRPPVSIVGPILKQGEIVGFAAVQIAPQMIDAITSDRTGLGETGETVGVTKIGNEVVVTTPTREMATAAFTLKGALGSSFPSRLQELALGRSGAGFGTDTDGAEVLGAWVTVPTLGWGLAVTQHVEEADALARAQQRAMIAIACVTAIAAVFVGWLVARSITKPIEIAASVATKLAQGDLSEQVPVIGRGETRALLAAMREAEQSLVALLQRVRLAGGALGATAREIRIGAREQGELAQQFGSTSTEIAAAVHEITSTQQELNLSVQAVATEVRQTTEAASSGRKALGRLTTEMNGLSLGASSIATRLQEIRDRADRINLVIASMSKIANQTNLLAVNAAMEAERAGEAGAGFRAVAREIRRLSAQTAEATLSIESIVNEMQSAVASGVDDMESYGESVRSGVTNATAIGKELGQVISGIERVGGELDLVARGMDAQALGVTQVAEAINSLTDGAARTAATSQCFASASVDLETRAAEFDREVKAFQLP